MADDNFEYEIFSPNRILVNDERIYGLDNALAVGRKYCEEMDAKGGIRLFNEYSRRLSPDELRGHTLVMRYGGDGIEYVGTMADLLERENARGVFADLTEKCLEIVREAVREEFERERQMNRQAELPDAPAKELEREINEPEP